MKHHHNPPTHPSLFYFPRMKKHDEIQTCKKANGNQIKIEFSM